MVKGVINQEKIVRIDAKLNVIQERNALKYHVKQRFVFIVYANKGMLLLYVNHYKTENR